MESLLIFLLHVMPPLWPKQHFSLYLICKCFLSFKKNTFFLQFPWSSSQQKEVMNVFSHLDKRGNVTVFIFAVRSLSFFLSQSM